MAEAPLRLVDVPSACGCCALWQCPCVTCCCADANARCQIATQRYWAGYGAAFHSTAEAAREAVRVARDTGSYCCLFALLLWALTGAWLGLARWLATGGANHPFTVSGEGNGAGQWVTVIAVVVSVASIGAVGPALWCVHCTATNCMAHPTGQPREQPSACAQMCAGACLCRRVGTDATERMASSFTPWHIALWVCVWAPTVVLCVGAQLRWFSAERLPFDLAAALRDPYGPDGLFQLIDSATYASLSGADVPSAQRSAYPWLPLSGAALAVPLIAALPTDDLTHARLQLPVEANATDSACLWAQMEFRNAYEQKKGNPDQVFHGLPLLPCAAVADAAQIAAAARQPYVANATDRTAYLQRLASVWLIGGYDVLYDSEADGRAQATPSAPVSVRVTQPLVVRRVPPSAVGRYEDEIAVHLENVQWTGVRDRLSAGLVVVLDAQPLNGADYLTGALVTLCVVYGLVFGCIVTLWRWRAAVDDRATAGAPRGPEPVVKGLELREPQAVVQDLEPPKWAAALACAHAQPAGAPNGRGAAELTSVSVRSPAHVNAAVPAPPALQYDAAAFRGPLPPLPSQHLVLVAPPRFMPSLALLPPSMPPPAPLQSAPALAAAADPVEGAQRNAPPPGGAPVQ